MDAIREGMEFNGRVWKEPRGFIKILELLFGICAFATTSSFSSALSIFYTCKDKLVPSTLSIPFAYPFALDHIAVPLDPCNATAADKHTVPLGGPFTSSAEFFVAIGVLTFLYCLAALLMYLFLDKLYRSRDSVAQADFVVTAFLAFMWLVCASAWAHGVNGVKHCTDPTVLAGRLAHDTGSLPSCNSCKPGQFPNYANLNISVLLGFLNFFIWSGNVWFLWKETAWYRARYPTEGIPPTGSASGPLPTSNLDRI